MALPSGTQLRLGVTLAQITAAGMGLAHNAARAEPAPSPRERQVICQPDQPQLDHPQEEPGDMGDVPTPPVDERQERPCGRNSSDPRWSDWAITLWGGAMTDGNLIESLEMSEGFRSEYLGGIGVQRTIRHRRRIGLVVDANLLAHEAVARSGNPGQTFAEVTLGLGLKVHPTHWLSVTVVEGLSYYTSRSRLQLKRGGNGRQLVNYLAFEADAALNRQWSLVGRLHHRSGLFGALDCRTACDNNAYLLGVRYRFPTPAARAADDKP